MQEFKDLFKKLSDSTEPMWIMTMAKFQESLCDQPKMLKN